MTFLLVLALDRDLPLLLLQKTILLGFFALFPMQKVRSALQVSAGLPRHVSSWTPAAYVQPSGFHEEEKEKEKELKAEEEEDEDPTVWTLAYDHKGRQYFWHRRTRRTAWEIPESAILRMKGMRKRKKRKKKKLPRGGCARRLRQWHDRAPRAVFASFCGRPSCLAFWWPRSSLSLAAAYAGLVLLVSLLALCSLLSLSGPDAQHHGWFVPEGQFFSGLVLLVILHLALCFLPCCLARDACRRSRRQVRIMAGMNQKDSYSVDGCCWYCTLRCVPFLLSSGPECSHHGRYGPEGGLRRAVHQGRLHSCRFAEADPMVSQTIEIPQLLDKVVAVSVVQVVWFHRSSHFPVVVQRQSPWSKLFV